MRVESAIELIGNLCYKPGWIIEARDNRKRFQNSIVLTVTYPATNSDRDQAVIGFPNPIPPNGAYASFTILCDQITKEEQLYAAIAEVLMTIEAHEMREFLRVKPTYWAPFHPHNTDGIRRYAEVTGTDEKAQLNADLTFGLC